MMRIWRGRTPRQVPWQPQPYRKREPASSGISAQTVIPNAIATAESVSSPTVTLSVLPNAVGTGESVFAPTLTLQVLPGTIATVEQVFAPALSMPSAQTVTPNAIGTAEAVYQPNVTITIPGSVQPNAIPSAEVVFAPVVLAPALIVPETISTAEQVFAPRVNVTFVMSRLISIVSYAQPMAAEVPPEEPAARPVVLSPTLHDIQVGIKRRLETIDGLRATATETEKPNLPTAYPRLVSWMYDTNFEGQPDWAFDVWVLVGIAPDMNRAQTMINAYLSPSGRLSLKCAIEDDPSLGGCVSFSRVTGGGNYGRVDIGGTAALGASVRVEVSV